MMVPTQVAHLARHDLRPWGPETLSLEGSHINEEWWRMVVANMASNWLMLRYVEICWVSNVFLWVLVNVCSKLIGLGHLNLGFRWCQARSVGKTWLVRNVGQFVKKYVIQQVLELDLWMPLKFVKLKTWRILADFCWFLLISVDFGTLGTLHALLGSPRVSLSADPGVSQQPMGQRVIKACRGEQIWM